MFTFSSYLPAAEELLSVNKMQIRATKSAEVAEWKFIIRVFARTLHLSLDAILLLESQLKRHSSSNSLIIRRNLSTKV